MIYLDTSALLKLLVEEDESEDLERWLGEHSTTALATSALSRVELARACRRLDAGLVPAAESLLGGIDLVPLQDRVLRIAAELPDPAVRSLDALHVASALALETALDVLVAYDVRLLSAAEAAGLATARPGA